MKIMKAILITQAVGNFWTDVICYFDTFFTELMYPGVVDKYISRLFMDSFLPSVYYITMLFILYKIVQFVTAQIHRLVQRS